MISPGRFMLSTGFREYGEFLTPAETRVEFERPAVARRSVPDKQSDASLARYLPKIAIESCDGVWFTRCSTCEAGDIPAGGAHA